MRICYICNGVSPHIRKFLEYFRADHEVFVMLFSDQSFQMEGIKEVVIDLRKYDKRAIARYAFYPFAISTVRKRIRQIQPHIIHIHYISSGPRSLTFHRMRNLVISVWGNDVIWDYAQKEPIYRVLMKKYILRLATKITATSAFLKDETRKYISASDHKKLFVIPFGVDIDRFDPSRFGKKQSKEITIGYVKSLERKYGPEYLIRAFAQANQTIPNSRLVMVGDGQLKTELVNLVEQLGISRKVDFVGAIDNDLVPVFLAKMDIFAMPSVHRSETFGVAALEASAMKIPVVASRIGGVPETVIHRKTGILVAPKNVDELSEAILELIEDPTLRRTMGENGRQHVLDRFNLTEISERFAELYTSLITDSTE